MGACAYHHGIWPLPYGLIDADGDDGAGHEHMFGRVQPNPLSDRVMRWSPECFTRFGIDWTRNAKTKPERSYFWQSCPGAKARSRRIFRARQTSPKSILSMKLRKHRDDALETVHDRITHDGPLWS
jgi:hypothetical protein